MSTTLIHVRPGLVLAPDELLDHADDPDVARIVEERWPPLFEPEVEFEEEAGQARLVTTKTETYDEHDDCDV